MKDKGINEVKKCSFLGVVVISNLTWKAHIDKICSKISSNFHVIECLK